MPVSIYGHKGTVVLMILLVLSLLFGGWLKALLSEQPSGIEWLLLGFAAFAALSSLWSPHPSESFGTSVSVAAAIACGCLIIRFCRRLAPAQRRLIVDGIILGGGLGYGLLLIEYFTDGSVTHAVWHLRGVSPKTAYFLALKPSNTIGAIFLAPWGYALLQRLRTSYAVIAVVLACAAIIIPSRSDAAIVASAMGGFCAIAASNRATLARPVIALSASAMVLAMPLIAGSLPDPTQPGSHLAFLPNSAIHRIDIWHHVVDNTMRSPVFGLGFDASRMLYGPETTREVVFIPDAARGPISTISEPIPLHPHNGFLQVWLETGFVGALICAVMIALIGWKLLDPNRQAIQRAVGAGFFAGALSISSISYGAWQSWWVATIILVAGLVVMIVEAEEA